MTLRALGGCLAAALLVCAAVVAHGGGGVLYVLIFAAAVAPGVPLGLRLFGRTHPAGWIAAALIGYVITAFAVCQAINFGTRRLNGLARFQTNAASKFFVPLGDALRNLPQDSLALEGR